MQYNYQAVFVKVNDGIIAVTVPDLPGLHTQGKTFAQAINMAQDATVMWLRDALDNGDPIPESTAIVAGEGEKLILITVDID